MTRSRNEKGGEYTNRDIAVMAVYRLGGALRYVHLEDAAMKAAELSPRRFRWKKYPEQINLEAVRVTLKDELQAANARVDGSIRDGWMLTPEGFSWSIANNAGKEHQTLLSQIRQQADRARKSRAFSRTLSGEVEQVSTREIDALLRVNQYCTVRQRREQALALANAALLDPELGLVLARLRDSGFDELEVRK